MSVEWESGALEYVVIGIGINCGQRAEDFPKELREKATSIRMETDRPVDRNKLIGALIRRLSHATDEMLDAKAEWLRRYASDCITVGRPVRILRGERIREGTATGIDENGALLVRYENGETEVIVSGEVSVRGTHGYI